MSDPAKKSCKPCNENSVEVKDGILHIQMKPDSKTPDTPKGGGKNMSLLRGVIQMGSAKLGGRVDRRVSRMRRAICQQCMQVVVNKDGTDTSERLFRVIDDIPYCGQPFFKNVKRNEFNDGCGCNLDDKKKWKNSECPRKLWGPGANFGQGIFAIFTHEDKEPLPDTIDVHLMSRDRPPDVSGIGDTLSFLPIVHALRREHADKKVRYVIIKRNEQWARLAYDDLIFNEDPEVIPGDTKLWSNLHGFLPVYLDARARGENVHEWWARSLGVSGKLQQLVIKPTPDADLDARQRLAEPIIEDRPIVAISPFSNLSTRTWHKRHWLKLVQLLQAEGIYVLLFDGPEAKRTSSFPCQRYWGWPAEGLVGLLNYVDLHIGNDSAMSHLSGVTGTRGLALCGPTDGEIIYGWYDTVEPIQAPKECTACLWQEDAGWELPCTAACWALWDLQPETVFERAMQLVTAGRQDEEEGA